MLVVKVVVVLMGVVIVFVMMIRVVMNWGFLIEHVLG